MAILVDDEERENEGDLVLAAEWVTPEAINFLAKNARGLICLALDSPRVDTLELPMMTTRNKSLRQTAFTVSIEAKEGVSTGISAADRTLEGLLAAKNFVRHEIAERLQLRKPPELIFQIDRSQELESRVDQLLTRAKKRSKKQG